MDLHPKMNDGIKVVTPAGRIDHASADDFQAALEPHVAACRESAPALVIDMSNVDYISSVGLRVLMIAAKHMRGRGAHIAVASLRPVVAEIFAISRFDSVLEVFPSVREAIAKLSPGALAAFDVK